jgi:hypothetical protein
VEIGGLAISIDGVVKLGALSMWNVDKWNIIDYHLVVAQLVGTNEMSL